MQGMTLETRQIHILRRFGGAQTVMAIRMRLCILVPILLALPVSNEVASGLLLNDLIIIELTNHQGGVPMRTFCRCRL